MNNINDVDIIWYRPCQDGYEIVNLTTNLGVGFFCSLRALKEYAIIANCIARKIRQPK